MNKNGSQTPAGALVGKPVQSFSSTIPSTPSPASPHSSDADASNRAVTIDGPIVSVPGMRFTAKGVKVPTLSLAILALAGTLIAIVAIVVVAT